MLVVSNLSTRKHQRDFVALTDKLYGNNPYYVPMLKVELSRAMKHQHPFYQHGDSEFFIAYDGNKPVGRICAYENQQYNSYHQQSVGFFGSFECINNQAVANALLEKAKEWLKNRGLTQIRGPIDYYSNEPQGCLISGFDSIPPAPLAYHLPYYQTLLETIGFTKQSDLYAYNLKNFSENAPLPRVPKLIERLCKQHQIQFRPLNLKLLDKDINEAVNLFNQFEQINGQNFIPLSQAEAAYFIKMMKPILDPELTYFAEKNGKTIGFVCAIPDVNELLVNIKNGNLLPTGIFKLLGLKYKKYNRLRIMLLGMLDEYQKIGLGPALSYKVLSHAQRKGFHDLDMSMIHQDNTFMLNLCNRMGAEIYKTYRVYQLDI